MRKQTSTCSHSCARRLAWRNEDMRLRHREAVRASRTPQLRKQQSLYQRARCAAPAERQKMSERNKKSWRDPVTRANRIVAIKEAWRGDKAQQRRAKARTKKLKLWADPEWAERTKRAMRLGKRGRFKRAVIDLVQRHATIEAAEIAAKIRLSKEQVKIIWRRAFRMGEVKRRPFNERNVTHCVHGHAFTPENTYVSKRGFRSCKRCARARHKKRNRAKTPAKAAAA